MVGAVRLDVDFGSEMSPAMIFHSTCKVTTSLAEGLAFDRALSSKARPFFVEMVIPHQLHNMRSLRASLRMLPP